VKKLIIDAGHASEDELKQIDRDIRATVTESAAFAQESPEPDPSELTTDIYLDA
jgi:pyruvate dehydrogenase E1 component alpha subunit